MTALTERSASDLARAIREGEVSAAEVVEAHIERHIRCAPRVNALVAERFQAARSEAAAADRRVASAEPGTSLPPLLGVPFTVKESIALAGMPNSAGLVARRDHRAGASATAVQHLIDAGAIPLGVTNTSELTLWIESVNRVYGRTSNPYDSRRVAGGSSGGEGAAVGCGGSPFGVAADIAGSIRVPALWCGVFGHKPTSGVVSNRGLYPPTPGPAASMLQTGPLARRGEDLMPVLRVMAGRDPEDPLSREVELGDPGAVRLEGLRVTTVEDASVLAMDSELHDARERAVGALRAAGADVRRVSLRSWRHALLPYLATLQAGAGQTTLELLAAAGAQMPTWGSLVRGGPHVLQTRITLATEMLSPMSETRQRRLIETGRAIAAELVDAIGDGVLLHPAQPHVAPRHGTTIGRGWLLTFSAVFNLPGVPVTEVPLGLDSKGLPLGIQVAAGRDRDHVAIAVAMELERVFGGWVAPVAA